MVITRSITGRIDDLDDISTRRKLHDYLLEITIASYVVTKAQLDKWWGVHSRPVGDAEYENAIAQRQPNPFDNFAELWLMWEPLDIPAGTYMVDGIEGPYNDGYGHGTPWPMQIDNPNITTFEIMQFVATSPANALHTGDMANHVYFEDITIDTEARTIKFGMGS